MSDEIGDVRGVLGPKGVKGGFPASGGNFVRLSEVRSVSSDARTVEILELLDALRELAVAGRLSSLLYVSAMRDGSMCQGFSSSDDRWRDLAGWERLRYRISQMQDEG